MTRLRFGLVFGLLMVVSVPEGHALPDSCTSIACPASALPSGFETVSGQQIRDQNSNVVRWACTQFRGGPGEPGTMAAIRQAGFNCIRIDWRDAFLMGTNPGFSDCSYQMSSLIQCVNDARSASLKVILDHHANEFPSSPSSPCWGQQQNGLWYDVGGVTDGTDGCGDTGTVDYATFKSNWVAIATQFSSEPTVIGFDLHNEPLTYGSNTSSQLCWGCATTADYLAMANDVGAAIQVVNPGVIVIVEGPLNNSTLLSGVANPLASGSIGDLTEVPLAPVTGVVGNKLLYSVHDYPTSVSAAVPDSGPTADGARDIAWGSVAAWIGEMGCGCLPANADENAWASDLVAYVNARGIGTTWFSFAYTPAENPPGILEANGTTLEPNQQAYWQALLWQGGAPPAALGPKTVIILGDRR